MKRFIPFAMLLMAGALVAPSAKADITSRMTSSVQLQVNAAATQDDPGESFSFTQAFTQADAIDTTGPDIGDVSAYGDQLSTAAGTAGSLAGTVTSQGALTVTAGGAGTVATGQFVTELSIN